MSEDDRPRAPALPARLVGVSLKMYFGLPETISYLESIERATWNSPAGSSDPFRSKPVLFIVPPMPVLNSPIVTRVINSSPPSTQFWLGAQNAHSSDDGPFTGETSPKLLSQIGVKILEIGHAERRAPPFAESDDFVDAKITGCVRNYMVPLVCVGEKERNAVSAAVADVEIQVVRALNAVVQEVEEGTKIRSGWENIGIVFAYEPIWAIGASQPADPEYVVEVVKGLRAIVKEAESRHGWQGQVRFLYGGSAGPGTWERLKSACDGLFLGRFAHKVENLETVWREVVGS